jgi:hypothetical protein
MVKQLLFVTISIFLIYFSYDLISKIVDVEITSWPWIIFTAWAINMAVTGIFAFPGFVLPTERLLPDSYYHIRQPERLARVFRILGVEAFRKFLLATLWRDQKRNKQYFNGTPGGMDNLLTQSRKSEFGHLIPFLLLIVVSAFFFSKGKAALGSATIVINILGNFYPVILQRQHRLRISRIRQRFQ